MAPPVTPEKFELSDSTQHDQISTALTDHIYELRQERPLADNRLNNTTVSNDTYYKKLAQDRADINRSLTKEDNRLELIIPLVTGISTTVKRGGRTELPTTAEATKMGLLKKNIQSIAPGALNSQLQSEFTDIQKTVRMRGQLKEAGAITAAVAADCVIDNYVFKNQQSGAATYLADLLAPIALSSTQWKWKIGGMILSHTIGKFIDSFYQPKYRFNPQDPREQTLPEYLIEHPEAQ